MIISFSEGETTLQIVSHPLDGTGGVHGHEKFLGPVIVDKRGGLTLVYFEPLRDGLREVVLPTDQPMATGAKRLPLGCVPRGRVVLRMINPLAARAAQSAGNAADDLLLRRLK
jgi:hypothetical protein